MIEKRNEIEIVGNIEDIWHVLTDLAYYEAWNPIIYRAVGKIEMGEEVVITAHQQNFNVKVAQHEPLHVFSWKFYELAPFLYRGEHIFRLEAIDEQKVLFIDREIFEGLLAPFKVENPKSTIAPGMMKMGQALKVRIENE